jgi:SAM-dependent methyltransferase
MVRNTDKDWKHYGEVDPFFGVLSDPEFRTANLCSSSIDKFYASGEKHVAELMERMRQLFGEQLRFRRILDFGCGVGRLGIPFARYGSEITCVDVSEGMLKIARDRCKACDIENVRFITGDDQLSGLEGQYDLVHSYIVFQHIPVERGIVLARRLYEHLANGGVGAVHFTFGFVDAEPGVDASLRLTRAKRVAKRVLNRLPNFIVRPYMQMNDYPMEKILSDLYVLGASTVHLDFVNHSGHLGAYLFFRRPGAAEDAYSPDLSRT